MWGIDSEREERGSVWDEEGNGVGMDRDKQRLISLLYLPTQNDYYTVTVAAQARRGLISGRGVT